jgi:autotransporter translocation and assembly factor TamB
VAGTLAAPRGSAALDRRGLSLAGVPIGALTLRATADARRLVVDLLEARRGDDRVTGAGAVDLTTGRIAGASLAVAIHDLGPYLGPWLPRDWPVGGALEGSVTLAGEIIAPEATGVLAGHGLSLGGRPLGEATLRGHSAGTRLTVDAAEVHRGADHLAASGTVDLAARRLEGVALDAAVADLGPDLAGLLPQDRAISGGVTLALRATGPFAAPQGSLAASLRDGRIGDLAVAEAELRARATGGQIVVESLAAHTAAGDVAAAGAVTRAAGDGVQVDLDALALSWQGRGLALAAPARLTLGRAGPYTVDRLVLSGEIGTVELAGVLAPAGESDLTLGLHDLTSDGWLDALMGERVTFSGLDATLHVAGTRAAPRLAVACGVRRLGGTGRVVSFTGAFDLAYGDRRLQVSRCDWSAAAGQRLTVTASLPLDPETPGWLAPGAVALDATLDLPDLGWLGDLLPPDLRSDGSVSATAVLAGTWDHPVGRVDVAVHGLSLPAALQPAPPGPYTVAVRLGVDGHDLSLEELRIDAPGAHLTAAGTWSDFPSVRPFLVTGDARPLAGAVHLDGAFALSELGWAAARLEGVQRLAGAIEGEVAVDGPARAPRAVARLAVTDGEVRLATGVPAVRAIHATAEVTPGAVRITDARGEVGGAPFRRTCSVTRPAGGKPVVELALTGTNLLLFRGEGVKVRADTDLHVRGPLARLAVAGELAITDGRLVKNVDLLSVLPGWGTPPARGGVQLFSIPAPPLRDATLRVRVTTKEPFEIKSNVARGTVRPELLLQGTGEIPVVQGEVYVDPIRISLPAGILRVESGVVRFLAGDPDRPRLDLSGRARMLGYDISVIVEGPYDEPVVTLSSVPPLLEEELLLLLLTGHPPKTGATQAATHAAGMNVAVYVGKGMLARLFSDQSAESDESVLDRFEVEIGRGVTRAGQETIDAQFRLAEGVVRDGDVLYITTEKDVYDDVNAGLKIVFRFK